MKRNVIGECFGRYEVLEEAEPNKYRVRYVVVRCECGTVKTVRLSSLTTGVIVSCGCFNREKDRTHGLDSHPLAPLWRAMIRRCENPKNKDFPHYGGRGISVCEAWHSLKTFIADMGERPSSKHTLDRIDTDGNYCPDNVRWATQKEQQRNRKNNRLIAFDGETKCLAEWAEEKGLKTATLWNRLRLGWSVERALTT